MDPAGEGVGYDRVEELMREEIVREGCTRPKQQRRGEGSESNAGSLRKFLR